MQDDEIKIFTHEDLFGVDRVEFVTQDRYIEEEYEKITPAELAILVQNLKEEGHKVGVQTSWFGDDDFEPYGPDIEIIEIKKGGKNGKRK
jgi:hypothetical protein